VHTFELKINFDIIESSYLWFSQFEYTVCCIQCDERSFGASITCSSRHAQNNHGSGGLGFILTAFEISQARQNACDRVRQNSALTSRVVKQITFVYTYFWPTNKQN